MSVSSLEGSPVPVDLSTKYQKLATEYAKIRAQFGVLKKAVIDEQSNSAELKETLRIKDQNLRKAEQELDSLNFRNQQLTKRVTILQDELDALQNLSKKGKTKHSTHESGGGSVIMEELEKKISENAHLISLLQEQNDKYENEKFKLTQEHEILDHELQQCKKSLSTIEEKLTKIENENKDLIFKLNAKEDELRKSYNELKLFKNDTNEKNWLPINIELKDKFSKVIETLPLKELFKSIQDFFRFFQLRYKISILDENKSQKFLQLCQKNDVCLQEFISKFSSGVFDVDFGDEFVQASTQLSTIINNYVIVLEELSQSINISTIVEVNNVFKDIVSSFKKHWMQFHSALKTCLFSSISPSESEDCITRIADVFRSLRSTCDYFLSALNELFNSYEGDEMLEKEILTSLSKISTQSGLVFKKVSENLEVLSQIIEYRPKLRQVEKTSKSVRSDQCCDHWKQEYELLKMTHSKKVKDLEEQISCLSGATTPRSNNSSNIIQSPVDGKGEPAEVTNMFGSLSTPLTLTFEIEEQDSELKKFFNNRANALVADRQMAESKVTALKDECAVLQKRLEHSLECRLVLEASVKQAQDTVSRLQEELTTTTTNYEIQLSSMSEHMANMNDRLAAQQEEIEHLNYQLNTKGIKKGKPK